MGPGELCHRASNIPLAIARKLKGPYPLPAHFGASSLQNFAAPAAQGAAWGRGLAQQARICNNRGEALAEKKTVEHC